jgi:DNA ligase 1
LRAFATLFDALDEARATNTKVALLKSYFLSVPAADAAWAVYFLAGGKPKQLVSTQLLRQTLLQHSAIPLWLFEESYGAVGDLAETIALMLPKPEVTIDIGLTALMTEQLLPLRGQEPGTVMAKLGQLWLNLDSTERYLLNKIITGGLRVGVSKLLVIRGLEQAAGVDAKVLAQRMIGYTDAKNLPTAEQYLALTDPSQSALQASRSGQPYPFFLAHPLLTPFTDEASFEAQHGQPQRWQIEWKWDGIRAQLIKREGQWWLWSRGELLITDSFPELAALALPLNDGCVLDGEVVPWDSARSKPLPFAKLQQRLARKTVSAKLLKEVPVIFIAYDLLELNYQDLREQHQTARRSLLEGILQANPNIGSTLQLSTLVRAPTWRELFALREQARERAVEGLMLKSCDAQYGVGRTKSTGVWWKWKIDPLSIDCVLIYAQAGHGRRAGLYTDYTFAVWEQGALVPFAKAYSGLTDAEFTQVDAIIKKTTIEKFGPVRSVTPTLVFELGFEAIQPSPRHKSGVAVRFPRMLRWRKDKTPADADSLQSLKALLQLYRDPPVSTTKN